MVYGTVVSSRPPELEGVDRMIGLFINANPVRVCFDDLTCFHELAKSLHKDMGESQNHAHYPMADIQEQTSLKGNLLDHLYGFQNYKQPTDISLDQNQQREEGNEGFHIESTTTFEQTNYDLNVKIFPVSRLGVMVEYNANAYELPFVQELISQVISVAEQAIAEGEILVKDINITTSKNALEDFLRSYNARKTEYPRDSNIIEQFNECVKSDPQKIALVHNEGSMTYKELDQLSNQVAQFILKQGIEKEGVVTVYLSPSTHLVVAILGVLKSGASYLPINVDYPLERIQYMINDSQSTLILSESKFIKELNHIQWECSYLRSFICLDSENVYEENESRSALMDRELWEYVGSSADDDIAGGGWVNSYSGDKFTRQEMDEYGDNALNKLLPHLNETSRVLEIGCASGITMFRIAPHVGVYYGTDLSQTIIDYNQKVCEERDIQNVQLACLEAEKITELEARDFDVIIINSVVQCFSGHNYLRNIIKDLVDMLADQGKIFLGDLYDQSRKKAMISSMKDYKKTHLSFKTKIDFSNELFVDKEFLNDLKFDFSAIKRIEHTDKVATVNNEMTEFHYDSILYIDKHNDEAAEGNRSKFQFDKQVLLPLSTEAPNVDIEPTQVSNIIYTSGSTGQPKGVMVTHRGIVRLVKDTDYMTVTADDCWAQNVNIAFDPSTLEIFGALLNGATLSITDKDKLLDAQHFSDYLQRHHITMAVLITPVFHEFATIDPSIFAPLKTLIIGGEALSPVHVKKVKEICPNVSIVNAYGPTENTVISTTYEATGQEEIMPIGKPMSNSEAYTLDEKGQPLPIGVVGELGVAGDGVAKGYLNRPTLTDERFIPHPFQEEGRLYRTGDLARMRKDGNIEFMGREDNQVKIRGYRIELEEIESILQSISQVTDAVVTVIENEKIGKQLCAFVQLSEEVTDEEFQEIITIDLPLYMVPDFFVRMDKMPLTANGKIDRAAMPVPENLKKQLAEDYVPPANEIEEKLVRIWEDILGRQSIGTNDNFFKMGGHSLKATQLISRIYREMKFRIELSQIFETPTIREIANEISSLQKAEYQRIEPIPDQEYYAISHAQKRLWILNELDENQVSYNSNSAYVLDDIDPHLFEKAINTIVERHEVLRTTFENINGIPYQKIHSLADSNFKLEVLDLSDSEDAKARAETMAHEQGNKPFDLSKGPLIKALLVRLSKDQWLFAFTMHHIICDGWSMQVLTKEIDNIYEAFKNGKPNPLPALRIQYKDFVHWQNNIIKDKEEQYWMNRLAGVEGTIPLPFDFEKTDHNVFKGKNALATIDQDTLMYLKEMAVDNKVSLSSLIFTIFNVLLYNISGQSDLLVGVAIANRNHPDLENLAGFFVNILAIRNQIDEHAEFEEMLRRCNENMMSAFDHQNYPFDRIVEKLNPERKGNIQPLFNVLYGYQNFADILLDLGEEDKATEHIKAQGLAQDFEVSKFDLTLFVYEYKDGLQLFFEYNSSLFKESTVNEWMRYFTEFVQHACQAAESA